MFKGWCGKYRITCRSFEDDITIEEWEIVKKSNPDQFNSICLDRLNLAIFLKIELIKLKDFKDKLIVQADGIPMSGVKMT